MKTNKDRFEEYVQSNKAAFEEGFDNDKSWAQISKRLQKKTPEKRKFNWYAAASLILLFTTAWLLIDKIYIQNGAASHTQFTVSGKPFKEVELFYNTSIAEKTELIKTVAAEKNIEVSNDLEDLQNRYNALKSKIKTRGAQPQLVNALIRNLQMQIEILEQQLNILQELDQYSTSKNKKQNEISI